MVYCCTTDVARVRISSDKLWELLQQQEVSIVEYGNKLYEYCKLSCREVYTGWKITADG